MGHPVFLVCHVWIGAFWFPSDLVCVLRFIGLHLLLFSGFLS